MVVKDQEVTTVDASALATEDLSDEQIEHLQRTSTAPAVWPGDYEVDQATLNVTERSPNCHPA
jgi:hypothetical protein